MGYVTLLQLEAIYSSQGLHSPQSHMLMVVPVSMSLW
jgi:hypothetical protein